MDSRYMGSLLGVGHAEQLYAIQRTLAQLSPELLWVVFQNISNPPTEYIESEQKASDKDAVVTEIVNLLRIGNTDLEVEVRQRLGHAVGVDEAARLRDRIRVFIEYPDAWRRKVESKATVPAENFLTTVEANVNNESLSDEEFRDQVRRGLPFVVFPRLRGDGK
jgi:hypothetical protein